MSRTSIRGDATEALVRSQFLLHGLTVLEPVGTRHAFDLALLDGDRHIIRVQCKTSRRRGDCLLFNSCSTDHGAGRQDYVGRADVFAVADLAHRAVYVVDVTLAATRCTSLRLAPTRNGQVRRVLMAADHTVENWLTRDGVPWLPATAVT